MSRTSAVSKKPLALKIDQGREREGSHLFGLRGGLEESYWNHRRILSRTSIKSALSSAVKPRVISGLTLVGVPFASHHLPSGPQRLATFHSVASSLVRGRICK